MLIRVEDLKKGDEFLVTSGGSFRYWKALEDPKLMKQTPQQIKDYGGRIRYSGVRCSTKMTSTVTTGWRGKPYTIKTYECTPFEHNHAERINLNWKTMWLVRRDEL